MKRIIALSSAAALVIGLAAPAAANPAVLVVAPAAVHGISAGWAAAAGLGGVLFGAAIAHPWYGGYGYGYDPGYGYYGYPGYSAYVNPTYAGVAYDAPAYDDGYYGAPYAAPHYAYAAPHVAGHCYPSHRWVNGYRVPVRVCVTPY